MSHYDLWNDPIADPIDKAKRKTIPKGHAAPPGGGPAGETCKTCRHLTRRVHAKSYLKCGLMRKHWTGGTGTDVRSRDAACRHWEGVEK